METHVVDWEKSHPTLLYQETAEEFKMRAKATALALTEEEVDKIMLHTKKQLHKIVVKKGWYIRG